MINHWVVEVRVRFMKVLNRASTFLINIFRSFDSANLFKKFDVQFLLPLTALSSWCSSRTWFFGISSTSNNVFSCFNLWSRLVIRDDLNILLLSRTIVPQRTSLNLNIVMISNWFKSTWEHRRHVLMLFKFQNGFY